MKTTIEHKLKRGFLDIEIRLSDPCKNGHNDFSITGTLYERLPRIDRNMISGGCIHDEILQHRPDLKPLVDLHLCDEEGSPMHAVANGFYFLENMFKTAEYYRADDNTDYSKVLREHLRINNDELRELVELVTASYSANEVKEAMKEKDRVWSLYCDTKRALDASEAIYAKEGTAENEAKVLQYRKEMAHWDKSYEQSKKDIEHYRALGRDVFSQYVDTLRPRWKEEADRGKKMIESLCATQKQD